MKQRKRRRALNEIFQKKTEFPVSQPQSLRNYIFSPVELTVKTVSALTSIPQQRIVCLTLAVTSYKFLLPHELTAKEQVITIVFWVLVDSLEPPIVAEYIGEVKDFGDMMGRVAFLPVRLLGGLVSALMDCFPLSRAGRLLSWTGDCAIPVFNWFIDLARPFFVQDKLLYKHKGNTPEMVRSVHLPWSTASDTFHGIHSTSLQNSSQSTLTPVKATINAYIYRPLELTVKTVSALTQIPQQRVICLTLAVTSYKFLLPQKLTAKEKVTTAVFWVLVDSLEVPIVAEYTGEVKEFGYMMGRVAFLPMRILRGVVSLTGRCTWDALSCLVRPVYDAMAYCLTQSLNLVISVHNLCWPVISRCYNYLVFPLFVQEERQSSFSYYVLYAMNTILHAAFLPCKVLILEPVYTLIYYSSTDMSLNYIIESWINSSKNMAWYIVVYHWQLTSIVCLFCLWIWSIINKILNEKERKEKPAILRKPGSKISYTKKRNSGHFKLFVIFSLISVNAYLHWQ